MHAIACSRLLLFGVGALLAGPLAVASCGDGARASADEPGFGTIRDSASGSDVEGDDGGNAGDSALVDTNLADAFVWPDCSTQPSAAPTTAISDIWAANAGAPAEVWVPGVYVTAISKNGCVAGESCQIYVQSDLAPATLAAGAHKAIKVFVSALAATHFTGVHVGDQVDLLGFGWRYNLRGQNEILLEVNLALPGCAKKVGTGTVTPIPGATLSDFSVVGYESTYGPLLVRIDGVSGTTTANLAETFGLVPSADGGFVDAGGGPITSLSPFFLSGATFTTPMLVSHKHLFGSITGIYGLFMIGNDAGPATKYLEVYPRSMADLTVTQ